MSFLDDGLIVAGTDTGIGKTVLSALLTLALDACYWKPVQSGTEEETDSEAVLRMTGLPAARVLPEAYRLASPLSPDQSARIDGVTIDPARLLRPAADRPLVIEGAGGLMVPLSDDLLQIDLFASWKMPLLLAARSGLGTLNHTLLSVEALHARDVDLLGIVLIGTRNAGNLGSLARWCDAPVLGLLPPLEALTPATLMEAWHSGFLPTESWRPIA
jgi:dethiobiotin synthetase